MKKNQIHKKSVPFNWKIFIGFVLTILGLIPAYIALYKSPQKALSYEIPFSFSLDPIGKDFVPEISIFINGDSVNQPYFNVLKISNNGNIPIMKKDYDKPITIKINNKSKIVNYKVGDKNPENIDVLLKSENNNIIIEPLLLNPTDFILLEIITKNGKPDFNIATRIVGIPKINLIETKINETPFFFMFSSGFLILFASFSFALLFLRFHPKTRTEINIPISSSEFYFILLFLFFIKIYLFVQFAIILKISFITYIMLYFLLTLIVDKIVIYFLRRQKQITRNY